MEYVFEEADNVRTSDRTFDDWIDLKATVIHDPNVHLAGNNLLVMNQYNMINITRTFQVRILQEQPFFRTSSVKEIEARVFWWAMELLLMRETFTGMPEKPVEIYASSVLRIESPEFRALEISAAAYANVVNRAVLIAQDYLMGDKEEAIKEKYANALIIGALYRKYNGDGKFTDTSQSPLVLAKMFFYLPKEEITKENRFLLDVVTGRMFESLSGATLANHAVLVSQHNPLGRTVGLGHYPCANEFYSDLSLTMLQDEYKNLEAVEVSIVVNAVSHLKKQGNEGMDDFLACVLALEEKEYGLSKFDDPVIKIWWRNAVNLADRIRIQSHRIYDGNPALKYAATVHTWWKYKGTMRSDLPGSFTITEVESEFISTAQATHIQAGNGDEHILSWVVRKHNFFEHQYDEFTIMVNE
jgi:hypothetical protein